MATHEKASVRIGCAAGFWGDSNAAAGQLVRSGKLDYLVLDYLAEVTMSLLAAARRKDPTAGYATDFVSEVMAQLAHALVEHDVKVIANAGGVNPEACRTALQAALSAVGVTRKIAVVLGDDLQPRAPELRPHVLGFDDEPALPLETVSMNAYLGAKPIADALARGADVVITGRVVDSAMVLGPLLHEFGWTLTDYDQLAQGSLAGHIIECGPQCTGGNFTDWHTVPRADDIGYPIVACAADGSFVVEKPPGTGGLVTRFTVGEQVLYEIGDPRAYLLPDVTCDLTGVVLEDLGGDRVRVSGARGHAPSEHYKVSATFVDGQRTTATLMVGGIDAGAKGAHLAESILARVRRLLREQGLADFREARVELLGTEATYGANAQALATREVLVRIACVHDDPRALRLFGKEIAQAATSNVPGIFGFAGGRPRATPRIRLASCLVPKSLVPVTVDLDGVASVCDLPSSSGGTVRALPTESEQESLSGNVVVPLVKLAVARSGDKGDHSNIGVMARAPEYLPFLRAALSEAAVAQHFRHVLHPERGSVTRWELPGFHALNFLLKHALGGGGVASLRMDSQGKAHAQQLLDFPVLVPASLAAMLTGADAQ